jgi:hypothetical protein
MAAGLGGALTAVGLWAWAAIDNSESWGTLPYQGHLELGGVAANGTHDFCFRLYDGATPIWAEAQAGVAVQAGAFAVRLGTYTVLNAAVEAAADLSLEVNVVASGTTGARTCAVGSLSAEYAALAPRQRLGSAAYAISAKQGVPGQDFIVGGTLRGHAAVLAGTIEAAAGFGYVPIGTIMAWHKNATGTALTLPPGWAECDGTTVSVPANGPLDPDGDSEFQLPDLNNDAYADTGRGWYLRGGLTSGTKSGSSRFSGNDGRYRGDTTNSYYGATYGRWNDTEYGDILSYHTSNNDLPHPTTGGFPYVKVAAMTVVWIMRIQ